MTIFILEDFELLVRNRSYEPAARELLGLLIAIDGTYGSINNIVGARNIPRLSGLISDQHQLFRLTSAISTLFLDPNFYISRQGFMEMIVFQRWLAVLFASSPFKNADHILRSIKISADTDLFEVSTENLYKFGILFFPLSEITLNLDGVWEIDPEFTASLCLALLSPRFLGEETAHAKREVILPWLTKKLPEIESLDRLPSGILHDVYMHCSYADLPEKHDIKKSINILLQRKIKEWAIGPVTYVPNLKPIKPTLLVVVEWFTSAHSIYRTHSKSIEGAREYFNVIGMGYEAQVDDITRDVFDEFIPIKGDNLQENILCVREVADVNNVDVLYMPSIGMFQLTMYLANLRLAPLQAVALGHPATTHSVNIDLVVVEEDYVGDPACFSETLMLLPSDGMPYRPSSDAMTLPDASPPPFDVSQVHVIVAATPMKLNPAFLNACKAIKEGAKSKILFHFLGGSAHGMIFEQLSQFVRLYLGDAVKIYPHQTYHDYMSVIRSSDLFINPFPFGNTNGIIDCITAGLVGVCKTGREVNEHIDEGLFKRLNLPENLIAKTVEDYIIESIRLIDEREYRNELRIDFSGPIAVQTLFNGRNNLMGLMFLDNLKMVLQRLATNQKI